MKGRSRRESEVPKRKTPKRTGVDLVGSMEENPSGRTKGQVREVESRRGNETLTDHPTLRQSLTT